MYNNIWAADVPDQVMITLWAFDASYSYSLRLFNNTFILKKNVETLASLSQWEFLDTLIMKNNIVYCDNDVGSFSPYWVFSEPSGTEYSSIDSVDIDYNYYWKTTGDNNDFVIDGDSYISFATWQGGGYLNDVNGAEGTIAFSNLWGTDIADYITTTGRGLGVDITAEYPELATDINGTARDASPDVGAIEYEAP